MTKKAKSYFLSNGWMGKCNTINISNKMWLGKNRADRDIVGGGRMNYITVNEAAKKWGVSPRSITYHLVAGRIEGAIKKGHMWLIPITSPKPQDRCLC